MSTTTVAPAPSGQYGFTAQVGNVDNTRLTVQVHQKVNGDWRPAAPAWYASDIAKRTPGIHLALDFGADWFLSVEDTDAFIRFAAVYCGS